MLPKIKQCFPLSEVIILHHPNLFPNPSNCHLWLFQGMILFLSSSVPTSSVLLF